MESAGWERGRCEGAELAKSGVSQHGQKFSRQTVRTPPGCLRSGSIFRADDQFYGMATSHSCGRQIPDARAFIGSNAGKHTLCRFAREGKPRAFELGTQTAPPALKKAEIRGMPADHHGAGFRTFWHWPNAPRTVHKGTIESGRQKALAAPGTGHHCGNCSLKHWAPDSWEVARRHRCRDRFSCRIRHQNREGASCAPLRARTLRQNCSCVAWRTVWAIGFESKGGICQANPISYFRESGR